jgi:hypothetical protein
MAAGQGGDAQLDGTGTRAHGLQACRHHDRAGTHGGNRSKGKCSPRTVGSGTVGVDGCRSVNDEDGRSDAYGLRDGGAATQCHQAWGGHDTGLGRWGKVGEGCGF